MSSLWSMQPFKTEISTPAIMQSLDSNELEKLSEFNPQLYNKINKNCKKKPCTKCSITNNKSLLLNGEMNLQVSSIEEFLIKLKCTANKTKVKVVSIFGNTGNGKSHTMNHVFFKGEEVFRTSNNPNCCTLGVWAAFDPVLNVICLDTEGLQGVTSSEHEHMKLLLKVLAVSDIVVYGIHSERLNRDLFTFLDTASHSYSNYFKATLQAICQREEISSSLSTFGPSVIVLHEIKHTKSLINNELESAEDILKTKFLQMSLEIDAFNSIKHVGLQTVNNVVNYEQLLSAIKTELNNTTVRSARKADLVYNALRNLDEHFFNKTGNVSDILFPEQYFTCPFKCLLCDSRCNNSMGHVREGKRHSSNTRCKYQYQYENVKYICKECYKKLK